MLRVKSISFANKKRATKNMTWEIMPEGIPNLLKDDWHLGYGACFDNKPLEHPENREYTRGWHNALGTLDSYNEQIMVDPSNPDYMDGYKRGCKLVNP